MKAYGVGATKRIAYRGARQCGSTHAPGANIAAAIRSQKKAERLAAKKDIEQWLETMELETVEEFWDNFYAFGEEDYLCDWDVEPVFSSSNAYVEFDDYPYDDDYAYVEFDYDTIDRNPRNYNPPLC